MTEAVAAAPSWTTAPTRAEVGDSGGAAAAAAAAAASAAAAQKLGERSCWRLCWRGTAGRSRCLHASAGHQDLLRLRRLPDNAVLCHKRSGLRAGWPLCTGARLVNAEHDLLHLLDFRTIVSTTELFDVGRGSAASREKGESALALKYFVTVSARLFSPEGHLKNLAHLTSSDRSTQDVRCRCASPRLARAAQHAHAYLLSEPWPCRG